MQIDIVIPTCNRKDFVVRTIKSIQANTFQDYHVWIVDQSEDAATATAVQPLAAADTRITYIHSQTKGVNTSRNIGIAAGQAPLVALTDDDCTVAETWLAALAAEYEAYPECCSLFGRILPVSASPADVPPGTFAEIQRMQEVLPIASKDVPERQLYGDDPFNISFGHGANMSFRRSAFVEFGLFDEFLGAGAPLRAWPELDIGYRILSGGGRILYSPHVMVYHMHWRTWDGVKKAYRNYAFGTGAAITKYVRGGDRASLHLLGNWLWHLGIRQILSGLLKYRSWHKMYAGALQLIYPWVGAWQSRHYVIDPHYRVYTGKKGQVQKLPVINPPA
jgi:glycosyltransferase involved in cell wall biosynthesis